jgi:predicted GTPase
MAEDRNEQFAMHTKKAKELLILCGKDIHKAIFVVDQANMKWKSLPNWSWKGLINNCASLLGE